MPLARNTLMGMMTAREAAFQAVLVAMRDEGFIFDQLQKWQKESNPTTQDFQLAQHFIF